MGNREHQNVGVVDRVDQTVWEPGESTTANAITQQMPSPGIMRNAMNGGQYFNKEGITETESLRIVPANGIIELDLCNVQKSSGHGLYLAMISLRSLAARSPRR